MPMECSYNVDGLEIQINVYFSCGREISRPSSPFYQNVINSVVCDSIKTDKVLINDLQTTKHDL